VNERKKKVKNEKSQKETTKMCVVEICLARFFSALAQKHLIRTDEKKEEL